MLFATGLDHATGFAIDFRELYRSGKLHKAALGPGKAAATALILNIVDRYGGVRTTKVGASNPTIAFPDGSSCEWNDETYEWRLTKAETRIGL